MSHDPGSFRQDKMRSRRRIDKRKRRKRTELKFKPSHRPRPSPSRRAPTRRRPAMGAPSQATTPAVTSLPFLHFTSDLASLTPPQLLKERRKSPTHSLRLPGHPLRRGPVTIQARHSSRQRPYARRSHKATPPAAAQNIVTYPELSQRCQGITSNGHRNDS